jgi:hypothetical protein
VRALVRRFGRWLVDWADGGRRIHMCRPPQREYGVSYDQAPAVFEFSSLAFHAVELRRGEACSVCGEVNA